MTNLLKWVSIFLPTLSSIRHNYSLLLLRSTISNCITNGVNYAKILFSSGVSKILIIRMISESVYVFKEAKP
jgi:hypothetical protein